MYLDYQEYFINGKKYHRALLRESYRENGKILKKTIANISHCSEEEIKAIKIALENKQNLAYLEQLAKSNTVNGKIAGPIIALLQVSRHLGIDKILGNTLEAKHILWLVLSRLIGQGSRLSAVRLAKYHYGCELIGIEKMNENILYDSMIWMYNNKDRIESNIFKNWITRNPHKQNRTLFLYDVSSSYLEGTQNEFGAWGYNRDKKKGKMQIVYGLLTDDEGEPLSVEIFDGNISDTNTVSRQISKIKHLYQCEHITFVGDKGMIKSKQIKQLNEQGFNYITSCTKAQIETLINRNIIQLELFTDEICEVEDTQESLRYILHRNPYRAEEIAESRQSKINSIKEKIKQANDYLNAHPKAKTEVQLKKLTEYVTKLKLKDVVEIIVSARNITIEINQENLEELSKFDGCYAIKTDLPKEVLNMKSIHKRYKSLAEIEWAFRTQKGFLEIRPIYLRTAERTVAHVIICMLAYKIELYLRECWKDLDLTVDEGISALSTIGTNVTQIGDSFIIRPLTPNAQCESLLNLINVKIPEYLPYKNVNVDTYKKLKDRRN